MNGTRYTTKELLARLVGFDTTSRLTNLPLVDFVRDYLASHGVAATLVPDDTGEKAALFATIGPNVEGGVVLSGHTDVVPVTGQPWTSDPFTLIERDGRLYGRGSADMKGFDATVLALVPDLLAAGLSRPIHIALSYDEEVGCLGVRPLAQAMVEAVARPAAVIVGEPTGMRPVDAHKSAHVLETEITGREAHSSAPERGVNAIIYAGRFIAEIERIGERLRSAGDPSGRFDPPCTTVGVGVVEGGTAHNIVPRQCRITWGLRGLPETDINEIVDAARCFAAATLEAEMQATAPEASVVITAKTSILPLKPEPGSSADRLIRHLTDVDTMGAVSYGTDAGFFQLHGWPAVVCGPGHIAQAHKPDEFIDESELVACEAFIRRLAGELAG